MTSTTVHDPVCHMDITINSAAGSAFYQGETYYFCAAGCKQDFDEDPEGVLKAEAEFDHFVPVDHGMAAADPTKKKPWWQFWSR